MAYFTVAVAWITWRSLVRVENCSGRTWVRTSNSEVFCTRGALMLAPGLRGIPVTLPRVVTTATLPAGTMNTVWLSRIAMPTNTAAIRLRVAPGPSGLPAERRGDCMKGPLPIANPRQVRR